MKHIISAFTLIVLGGAAMADPVVGIWKTEPDRKNLTAHVQIERCGDALCGTVVKAFDPSGAAVMTKNVGKRIFWGVKDMGGAKYGEGNVWVPMLNTSAKATMQLTGNALRVRGCKALVCDSQTWTRVR